MALRGRQKRNFMATLLLSQGVPMICGGDEIGRTQKGNNNAYCQDNEISWLHWDLTRRQRDLLEFCSHADSAAARSTRSFAAVNFFRAGGSAARGQGSHLVRTRGQEMTDQAWDAQLVRCLMVRLRGDSIDEVDAQGDRIVDDTFLLLLNAHDESGDLHAAAGTASKGRWERIIDTG